MCSEAPRRDRERNIELSRAIWQLLGRSLFRFVLLFSYYVGLLECRNILAPADTHPPPPLLSPSLLDYTRLRFIWAASLTPFFREETIRGIRLHPRGPEIRRAPQLIRHLIGDVWAQHRGVP